MTATSEAPARPTAAENRARKAPALARALWRRGLSVPEVLALAYVSRDHTVPTAKAFARAAYREAGVEANPPHSVESPTWGMTAVLLAQMTRFAAAHPDDPRVPVQDLLADRAHWTVPQEAPCQTPTTTSCSAPPAADTTSTNTTSEADACTPSAPSSSSTDLLVLNGPGRSATADGDPDLQAIGYRRRLGHCPACRAPVRWVAGPEEVMTLERAPSPAGGWSVDETTFTATQLPDWDTDTWPQYAAHRTLCPERPRARAGVGDLDVVGRCTVCWGPLDAVCAIPLVEGSPPEDTHPSCDLTARRLPGRLITPRRKAHR